MTLQNAINTQIKNAQQTAFGELSTANLCPQCLIHFPYNLNTDIVTTSVIGSGSVTHSGQFALVESGSATSSSGTIKSNRILEYHPGMGGLCRFTAIFGTGTEDNTQIAGIGSTTDGFFFGYNGSSFGICRRVGSTDHWTAQSSWSDDVMDGSGKSGMMLNPQNGNVYQIRYQWLGFGAITFWIEDQSTGIFVKVHEISYANQNTDTSVNNPSFPFYAYSGNGLSNSTSILIKIPSIAMFVEGSINNIYHTRNAKDNEKTISGATETNILTIRNKSIYQSVTNLVDIQPDFISIAVDGTKNAVIRFYINATLGGSPSYTDISTNKSVVDYDTAGTTVSNGTLVASIPISKTGNAFITFSDYNFILSPGQTFTVSALSSAGADVYIGLSWQERFS